MKDTTNKAKWEVEHAASEAVKVIASAASEASKVIANTSAEAIKVLNVKNVDGASDHDTLTTLVASVKAMDEKFSEKFSDIKSDIKGIGDNSQKKIDDHEIRLQTLEKKLVPVVEDSKLTKRIVFGACSFILLSVLAAIVYLVVKH